MTKRASHARNHHDGDQAAGPSLEQLRADHAAALEHLRELKATDPRPADEVLAQKLVIQGISEQIAAAEAAE